MNAALLIVSLWLGAYPTAMPPVRNGTAESLLSDASLQREELASLPADPLSGPSLETLPAPAGGPVITIPSVTAPSGPARPAWKTVDGVSFLSDAAVSGGGASGQFGVFEYNAAQCRPPGSAITSEFNYRSWSGPSHPNLPSNVFRFAWDFQLASEASEAYGFEVGFTPALVTDFDAPVRSDAFNWDGRAALVLRPASNLAITLGVAYWDRVNDLFIPYAGLVWTPDERWELGLMFPATWINYRLAAGTSSTLWAYGTGEYHVEAYQIDLGSPSGRDEKIQLADYRILFGLRLEGTQMAAFIEGGWVFDRHVKFLYGTPGFDIASSVVGRFGMMY